MGHLDQHLPVALALAAPGAPSPTGPSLLRHCRKRTPFHLAFEAGKHFEEPLEIDSLIVHERGGGFPCRVDFRDGDPPFFQPFGNFGELEGLAVGEEFPIDCQGTEFLLQLENFRSFPVEFDLANEFPVRRADCANETIEQERAHRGWFAGCGESFQALKLGAHLLHLRFQGLIFFTKSSVVGQNGFYRWLVTLQKVREALQDQMFADSSLTVLVSPSNACVET